METHIVKIKSISPVTHNVKRYIFEKPKNYDFIPGQATEASINREGWKEENRPFTFTSLPEEDHLEFTIKSYTDHEGVTNELLNLEPGDEFIIGEVFGAINYDNEGVFVAGGAGVTPFVAILRDLHSQGKMGNNKLIFANKTRKDIIYEEEFKDMLGDNFINVLAEDKTEEFKHGYIDEMILKENRIDGAKNVYLCGPPPMMDSMMELFEKLGIEENRIVSEDV